MMLMLRQSLDKGSIADTHTIAYVSPVQQGGCKHRPKQYRPVSLTGKYSL